jgi:hypothetical protein
VGILLVFYKFNVEAGVQVYTCIHGKTLLGGITNCQNIYDFALERSSRYVGSGLFRYFDKHSWIEKYRRFCKTAKYGVAD